MSRALGAILSLWCAVSLQASIDVEGPQDSLAGPPSINHCTLRKAVINANTNMAAYPQCLSGTAGVDTITIPAGMTITFALAGAGEDAALTGDLDITEDLIIQGNGATIDGADLDRIFHVHPGVTVTIYDLHLTDGNGNGGGGGIAVYGSTLNLYNVTISSCHGPNGDGGAILTDNNAVLNMTNCTISGNTAAHYAGGVIVGSGSATFRSCTITGNSNGFTNLTSGVHSIGTTTLQNTVIAGNIGVDLPNVAGFFLSLGHNIIGSLGTNPAAFTMAPATGDQIGASDAALHFGPLQNNGGLTPTHALLAGSLALDAGSSGGLTTDQRAMTRPCDNATLTNAAGGDGTDTGAFEEQVICASPNAAPVAVGDAYTMDQDTTLIVAAPGVLGNDSDTDGPSLTAVLDGGLPGLTLDASGGFAYTPPSGFVGTVSFTYHAFDGIDSSSVVTVTIEVEDTQPPVITASTALSSLWPPNGKLVDVGLSYGATDSSGPVTTSFVVTSDEDDITPGGGEKHPDAVGSLRLRADRTGTGEGRVYLIRITATDALSNTSHACLTVVVPRDQSARSIDSVNVQASDARTACTGAGMFVVGDE